jgi:hypothetical protein
MRLANQFTRRVIRTERSALIQITCVQCGFTAVGVKERIQIIEGRTSEQMQRFFAPPRAAEESRGR